jgi:hypothetical protein
MAKPSKNNGAHKDSLKEVKAEIIGKLTDALKEYKTPKSDKKLTKKIKKASKSITPLILKFKKEAAKFPGKKSA